jgi:hypothetical protein
VELLIGMDNDRWLSGTVRDHNCQGRRMRLLLSDFGNQYIVIGNWIQQAPGPPDLMMQEDDHVMEEVPSHEEKGVERGERHPPQPFPPVGHPKNKTNTGAAPFQQVVYNRTSRLGGKQEGGRKIVLPT